MAFRNALDFEVNLVPSGVEFGVNDTDPVSPNATKVYNWPVSDRVSPPWQALHSPRSFAGPVSSTLIWLLHCQVQLLPQAGPGASDASSTIWMYG